MRRLLLFGAVCGALLLGADHVVELAAAATIGVLCTLLHWVLAAPIAWAFGAAIRGHRPMRVVARTRGTLVLAGAITLFAMAVLPDVRLFSDPQRSAARYHAGAIRCHARHAPPDATYDQEAQDARGGRWAKAEANARTIAAAKLRLRACMDRLANDVARDGQLAPHARDVVDGMHWSAEGWARIAATLGRREPAAWSDDPDAVAGDEQVEAAFTRIEAILSERLLRPSG